MSDIRKAAAQSSGANMEPKAEAGPKQPMPRIPTSAASDPAPDPRHVQTVRIETLWPEIVREWILQTIGIAAAILFGI